MTVYFSLSAAQLVGDDSQSLVPFNRPSHSRAIDLPRSVVVINKNKYTNKQLVSQQLVKQKPNERNTLEGFKCLVCKSETLMHMHTIPCMRDYNNFLISKKSRPSKRPSRQLQICGTDTASEMTIVPCMAIQGRRSNLCCAHCNLEFNNEQQVLDHGHIVTFKSKYKIEENK